MVLVTAKLNVYPTALVVAILIQSAHRIVSQNLYMHTVYLHTVLTSWVPLQCA